MSRMVNGVPVENHYVCTNCFKRISECDCKFLPQAVSIDLNMQEPIRILQSKGYNTISCCESHNPNNPMYILFSRYNGIGDDNGFTDKIDPPSGFDVDSYGTCITYRYPDNTKMGDFNKLKKQQLDILLEWCENLPDHPEKPKQFPMFQ